VVVLEPAEEGGGCWSRIPGAFEAPEGQGVTARKTKPGSAHSLKAVPLTTPDLVLLSLLAERPMHGYQANAELERREIRNWAAISRPQVYYSLEKLARLHLLAAAGTDEPAAGPERSVFRTTESGRRALADALGEAMWTTARERPAFLTWLALSWQASAAVARTQARRRRAFVETELARAKDILKSIYEEVGHSHHEAVWMVTLHVAQFETELRWLRTLERELPRRAPARRPAYADPAGATK
jgi:DNA-binding PadR family transcriptional regulator